MTNTVFASIMVVDDKLENLRLMVQILDDGGYQVMPCRSGEEALRSLASRPFDLLLLDINMPGGMNGYEVANQVHSLTAYRNLPIIFISAYHDIDVKTKAFSHGGVDYISKPFHQDELLARISVHLRIKRLQEKLSKNNEHLEATCCELSTANQRLNKHWKIVHEQLSEIATFIKRTNQIDQGAFYSPLSIHFDTGMPDIDRELGDLVDGINQTCLEMVSDFTKRETAERELHSQHKRTLLLMTIAAASNAASNPMQAMKIALEEICIFLQWPVGHIYLVDTKPTLQLTSSKIWYSNAQNNFTNFQRATEKTVLRYGEGLPGQVLEQAKPVWITDINNNDIRRNNNGKQELNIKSAFAFPVILEGDILAVFEIFSLQSQPPEKDLLQLMSEIGKQLGFAIARKKAETRSTELLSEVQQLNADLEQRVNKRTHQLEQANQQLHELAQAKSQFLSTMSHEIRTPMNGVLGMVELIEGTNLTDIQRHYIEAIRSSGDTLLTVLNDILDFSKIEAGKLDLERIDFNLEKLIDDCAAIYSIKSMTSQVDLLADVRPGTPLIINGDPTRIRQIVVNLLSNAFKFTSQGKVRVTVLTINPHNKPRLKFEVSDTGIGIEKQQQSEIFSAFSQAEKSTSRRFGGSGLGLSICKLLCELMNGDIDLHSEPNRGSTFWFTLPILPLQTQMQVPVHSDKLQNKNLLIVDSDPEYCAMITAHTNSWGMQTQSLLDIQKLIDNYDKTIENTNAVLLTAELSEEQSLKLSEHISISNDSRPAFIWVTRGHAYLNSPLLAPHRIDAFLEKPFGIIQLHNQLTATFSGISRKFKTAPPNDLPHLEYLHVLVAEDNAVNQLVIKGMLNKFGISPVLAKNGLDALALFEKSATEKENKFDLILMDCEMPEMDGFEATKQIRLVEQKQSGHSNVAIIALSAHAMTEHKEHAKQSGMNDYLTKPVSLHTLRHIIKKHDSRQLQTDAALHHGLIPSTY